jgi:predicted secreted protein
MAITSAIVLYCVIWAVLFFMINPLWQTSQSEDGEVVPGTPASAPVNPMLRKKVIVTTVVATALFVLVYATIERGWLTIDDVSFVSLPSER